ncbi:RNA 2',3'-cyclic phosphodiesterase [Candidatus Pacearchaeota archaeon]|nr:MAG: RNA 2',3'-cyclic phosphodiesterase [Candidatus Pacearchaeota archaeon]
MGEVVRAFVCIDIPEEVARVVEQVQGKLAGYFNGRIVPRENLHLTLKFLGEISKEKVESVKRALNQVRFHKLSLTLDEIGTFYFRSQPRIIWFKIGGDVVEVQKLVDLALSEMFELERRFMSHLTIARVKSCDKLKLAQAIRKISLPKLKFQVGEFKLKSSVLSPNGAVYSTIASYSLNSDS